MKGAKRIEKRRTDKYPIAFEVLHLHLFVVNPDQGPVVHKPVAADLDLSAVENESANARLERGVVLGGMGMEFVRRSDLVLCRGDQVSQLLSLRRDTNSLACCRLWDPIERRLPAGNSLRLVADKLHDGLDRVFE